MQTPRGYADDDNALWVPMPSLVQKCDCAGYGLSSRLWTHTVKLLKQKHSQSIMSSPYVSSQVCSTSTITHLIHDHYNNNNIIYIFIVPFPKIHSAVAYINCPFRQSSQSFLDDLQLAKCMPYQHLDCNIAHKQQVPDVLKQIEIKYLAQGHKHAACSRAQTHNIEGLVIMSPGLFC